jgi:hypothetical protein
MCFKIGHFEKSVCPLKHASLLYHGINYVVNLFMTHAPGIFSKKQKFQKSYFFRKTLLFIFASTFIFPPSEKQREKKVDSFCLFFFVARTYDKKLFSCKIFYSFGNPALRD